MTACLARLEASDYQGALDAANAALAEDPMFAPLHDCRAAALVGLEQLEEARCVAQQQQQQQQRRAGGLPRRA